MNKGTYTYRRMGVGAAASLLDMWLEGNIQLDRDDFDHLCGRLMELLGDARDEMWRLRGTVDDSERTSPGVEMPGDDEVAED